MAQPAPQVAQAAPAPPRAARRLAVTLAVLLAAVIGVAFRGSWTAHSDGARAAHFDNWGAFLYPFAPDGLIVLALVGAVVLRHKFWPRAYCLFVVVLFTGTSYVVNHLHGSGTFLMTGDGDNARLIKPLDGQVVGLIAGQLVGAIAFGSHILMHVFRHLFPAALDAHAEPAAPATLPDTPPTVTVEPTAAPALAQPPAQVAVAAVPAALAQAVPPPAEPVPPLAQDEPPAAHDEPRPELSPEERAAREYAASLDRREPTSERALADVFGVGRRRAAEIVVEVVSDRYQNYLAAGGQPLTDEDLASQFRLSVARASEVLARTRQDEPEAEPPRATVDIPEEPDAPRRVVQLRPQYAANAHAAGGT
ncbi:hypothetical protein [Nonomuraea sp. GTA35]|uniref:hypothetical protein n=1 Tax=Nonomuraea sp. GTA35 TaxID=1676746 RepID=UPI0035BF2267